MTPFIAIVDEHTVVVVLAATMEHARVAIDEELFAQDHPAHGTVDSIFIARVTGDADLYDTREVTS